LVATVESNSEKESNHIGFDEDINIPGTSAYLTQCESDATRVTLNCPLNLDSLSGLTVIPLTSGILLCGY